MQMRMNFKRCAWLVALTLGMGMAGSAVRVAASPTAQDRQDRQDQHDQDYSKNRNYQQGMRDGRDDNAHRRDHSKKRKFKKDDDRKAYESGYQSAHHDNQPDHR